MNEAIKMQLSAFVDGELPENEKELLLRRLSQDAGLRQQVAEYLAIGHAVRGELQIGGVNALRNRIAAAIDEKPADGDHAAIDKPENRLVRPLVGIAVAATVALVAILGLRQVVDVENGASDTAPTTVSTDFPTQPDTDDLLRQYRLLHNAQRSYLGANSVETRLTVFEMLEDVSAEPADDAADANADDTDSEQDRSRSAQ